MALQGRNGGGIYAWGKEIRLTIRHIRMASRWWRICPPSDCDSLSDSHARQSRASGTVTPSGTVKAYILRRVQTIFIGAHQDWGC